MHSKKGHETSTEGGKAISSTEENVSANVNGTHEARRLVNLLCYCLFVI